MKCWRRDWLIERFGTPVLEESKALLEALN
jgi:hypothetical protein